MTPARLLPIGWFTIPAEHPALPGHFPGRPIVPGVMLLDRVIAAIAAGREAVGLPSVKFIEPVRPGEDVEILAAPADGDRVAFRCTVRGAEVARGVVQFESAP